MCMSHLLADHGCCGSLVICCDAWLPGGLLLGDAGAERLRLAGELSLLLEVLAERWLLTLSCSTLLSRSCTRGPVAVLGPMPAGGHAVSALLLLSSTYWMARGVLLWYP